MLEIKSWYLTWGGPYSTLLAVWKVHHLDLLVNLALHYGSFFYQIKTLNIYCHFLSYPFFVCNQKEFPYNYRQKMDNVTQLQIIDDKKQITEKKSVISACDVGYRLKRSGP